MKKIIVSLLLLVGGLALFGCVAQDTTTTAAPVEFATDTEVFALEALSATSLMNFSTTTTVSLAKSTTTTIEGDEPIVADSIDVVNEYLAMMERFLGDSNGLNVLEAVSDNPDYDLMVTFSTVDVLGEADTFVLYFNETIVEQDDDGTVTTTTTTEEATTTTEETTTTTEEEVTTTESTEPVSLQQGEPNYYFNEGEDDPYITYFLEGILVHGDVTYQVEGKLLDIDGEEVMKLYSYVDHDNYVRVEYKIDEEEGTSKFFYRVVEEAVTVSEAKVRISEDQDGFNILLELAQGTTLGRYHFKQEVEEDVTIIKIMYTIIENGETVDSGHIKIYKSIDSESGEAIYDYKVFSDHFQNTFNYRKHGKPEEPDPIDEASL